jgi:magnesium transporter
MASPPNDQSFLSSSPTSIGGGSPLRRRRSGSPGDGSEIPSRSRVSPTLVRSFDPNDPEVRERQRTMDVDMALQLSRARRETISVPTVTSPYEGTQQHQPSDPSFPILSPLSSHEQRAIDIARGEGPHPIEDDGGEVADDATLHPRQPYAESFHLLPHLHQTHDSSLLAGHLHTDREDPSTPMFGLPTYQPNASRSNFDFSLMEDFAAEEKATLGLTSPTVRFPGTIFQRRANALNDSFQPPITVGPSDGSNDYTSNVPRMIRQRKLSQSNTSPRVHRKGVGGKMALFEGNPGEPPPSLPRRLAAQGSALSPASSSDNIFIAAPGGIGQLTGPALETGGQGPSPGIGILNSGHDRPYRFSFYSNALSATIHARSLCELPADGQSFEDLFTGLSRGPDPGQIPPASSNERPISHSTAIPTSRSGSPGAHGFKGGHDGGPTPNNNHSNNTSYFNGNGNGFKSGEKSGVVRNGADFEGNTWWLDIQNPTDDEMKMLSKVSYFFLSILLSPDVSFVFKGIQHSPSYDGRYSNGRNAGEN